MAQINIKGSNAFEENQKANVLQHIADNLSLQEVERLGKIAKSDKARSYLNGKYTFLKAFLKL